MSRLNGIGRSLFLSQFRKQLLSTGCSEKLKKTAIPEYLIVPCPVTNTAAHQLSW